MRGPAGRVPVLAALLSLLLLSATCGPPADGKDGGGEVGGSGGGSGAPAEAQDIRIVLVAPGAAGPGAGIGCGDSLVATTVAHGPPPAGDASPADRVRRAVEALLERGRDPRSGREGSQVDGGSRAAGSPADSATAGPPLYDALSRSALAVDRARISGDTAVLHFTGELRPGGVCDAPRIRAQLSETVRRAADVSHVRIFVNGRPLEALLSGRG